MVLSLWEQSWQGNCTDKQKQRKGERRTEREKNRVVCRRQGMSKGHNDEMWSETNYADSR